MHILLCFKRLCLDAAFWSDWSEWSSCSKSCEWGDRKRNRTCLDTATKANVSDEECEGKGHKNQWCNIHDCPDNGDPNAVFFVLDDALQLVALQLTVAGANGRTMGSALPAVAGETRTK